MLDPCEDEHDENQDEVSLGAADSETHGDSDSDSDVMSQ